MASPTTKDPIVIALIQSRKEQQFTQETLAQAAGISRSALVAIEAGGDCTLSTLRKLAEVLSLELLTRQTTNDLPDPTM